MCCTHLAQDVLKRFEPISPITYFSLFVPFEKTMYVRDLLDLGACKSALGFANFTVLFPQFL